MHNDDPSDSRTRARRFHDAMRRKRLEQRQQLKAEAQAQGGNPEMHDDPGRENRILFDACDDVIREPDAISGAKEIERDTFAEEQRVHVDRDLEAVDDVHDIDNSDFDVV